MLTELPQHFIITRHGIGIYDEQWFVDRLKLLSVVTLPSIQQQYRSGLYWLIVVDAKMPQRSRQNLDILIQGNDFIHLVTINATQLPRMVQSGFDWIWQACQHYVLERGVIQDVTKEIITSIIDDDDAWHKNVIPLVDKHVSQQAQRCATSEIDLHRGYLVRHSAGMLMTFRHGAIWDTTLGRIQPIEYLAHSMSVFVYCRFSSNVSACTVRHASWPTFVQSVGFEMHVLNEEDHSPMWIYLRHPQALSENRGAENGHEIDDTTIKMLSSNFSIDIEQLKLTSTLTASTFASNMDAEKYSILDMQFKINALQKQSVCLQRYLNESKPQTNESLRLTELFKLTNERLKQLIAQFS